MYISIYFDICQAGLELLGYIMSGPKTQLLTRDKSTGPNLAPETKWPHQFFLKAVLPVDNIYGVIPTYIYSLISLICQELHFLDILR